MRLATLADGTRDGAVVVVSSDGTRCLPAAQITPSLRVALENWDAARPALAALADSLDRSDDTGEEFNEAATLAPLPRTWQWLDASAFSNHGALLARALNFPPIVSPVPLMYQGLSHEFLSPRAQVPKWREDGDLDFEGEFAVVLTDTPAGVQPDEAAQFIALAVLVNDWSQRSVAFEEMDRKFGYIEGKPACGMGPLAVTLDELGEAWHDGRVTARLRIDLNGERFGDVPGDQMDYSFGELIAYAARSRSLPAGTVIGSGTVSNTAYAEVGSSCIAERRGIEIIDTGVARTPYLAAGDSVRMSVSLDGRSIFGDLVQTIVTRQ